MYNSSLDSDLQNESGSTNIVLTSQPDEDTKFPLIEDNFAYIKNESDFELKDSEANLINQITTSKLRNPLIY